MKNRSLFIFPVFMFMVNLACGGLNVQPTAVPTATVIASTATQAASATPRPTSTPRPTATIAPTPTPAPVGVAVTSELYEVTVVKVRKLDTVYLDSVYHWQPNPGYLFLELGIKVKNLQPDKPVASFWENVYIVEENGDSWYPNWAAYKPVAGGVDLNPSSLVFAELTTGHVPVNFEDTAFLRAIWVVKDNNPSTVLFGFEDAPLIEVTID